MCVCVGVCVFVCVWQTRTECRQGILLQCGKIMFNYFYINILNAF